VDQQMETNSAKVFATGDSVNGASLVVTAIASGRKTARKIDKYLQNSAKGK
jgi:NADPH-dependent glutamate synthase beta subunit-like oxidoreductase